MQRMRDQVQQVSWREFCARFDPRAPGGWKHGQHVTIVGANGCGKTVLARELLRARKYVVALCTKTKDPSLDVMRREDGYELIRKWPPPYGANKVLLWPRIDKREFKSEQRAEFVHALNNIYELGSWCIYSDETYYLTKSLGLAAIFSDMWTQGRSQKISIVASLQRPTHVPLLAYTEATHLFFFRFSDIRDIKRVAGIGSLNAALIQDAVMRLPGPVAAGWKPSESNAFLYVNTRSGEMLRSRVNLR